jgi:hypothetical protein
VTAVAEGDGGLSVDVQSLAGRRQIQRCPSGCGDGWRGVWAKDLLGDSHNPRGNSGLSTGARITARRRQVMWTRIPSAAAVLGVANA